MISHVVGPARPQARSERRHTASIVRRSLPQNAYRALLKHLRRWIRSLQPARSDTQWQDYGQFHSYSQRAEFVSRFVAEAAPGVLWDMGCNTDAYSELALRAGAGKVIGFDYDHGALDRAVSRTKSEDLDMLPNRLSFVGYSTLNRLQPLDSDRIPLDCN